MSMKRLVVGVIAMLLFVGGCLTFKPDYWSSYGWLREPMQLERNGNALPFNKETCSEVFGPPAFTRQIPDGEICIWRDTLIRPPSGCKGHCDMFIAFDSNGNFMPPDPKADYGFRFCPRCRCDLRAIDADRCPECGWPVESRKPGSGE